MARLQGWKWALAGLLFAWAGLATSQTLGWAQRPGSGNDVGIGDDGSVWVVGTDPEPGNNFGIHRWRGDRWEKVAGGAVRIAVGPQGQPWIVNRANQIQYLTGSGWYLMPGSASDIGIGGGSVWIIGNDGQIYQYHPNGWQKRPGAARRIAVDSKGNPWVTNASNDIFRWNGSGWEQMPGKAADVGVGADGSVFVVGNNGSPFKFDGRNWVQRDGGGFTDIAVGPDGMPWGITNSRQIWQAMIGTRLADSAYRSRKRDWLGQGDALLQGEYLETEGHTKYIAVMHDDGNLCVYMGAFDQRRQLWCTETPGRYGRHFARVQADGRLCVLAGEPKAPGGSVWCSPAASAPKEPYTAKLEHYNGALSVFQGQTASYTTYVWRTPHDKYPQFFHGRLVVSNMWREAAAWITAYDKGGGILMAGCVPASRTVTFNHETFGREETRVRAEILRGTDGLGRDCSANKFCDTDMSRKLSGTVFVHPQVRDPTHCYLSEDPRQEFHASAVQNTFADRAVWATFYDGGFPGQIFESGCVPPGATRTFIHNAFQSLYYFRAEVMTGADCRGQKVCDTKAEMQSYKTRGKTSRVQMCYIDWN